TDSALDACPDLHPSGVDFAVHIVGAAVPEFPPAYSGPGSPAMIGTITNLLAPKSALLPPAYGRSTSTYFHTAPRALADTPPRNPACHAGWCWGGWANGTRAAMRARRRCKPRVAPVKAKMWLPSAALSR